MRDIREILRLRFDGWSLRNICKHCDRSYGAVQEVVVRATRTGLSWPLPEEMTDDRLEKILYPQKKEPIRQDLPDWVAINRKMTVDKHATLAQLWEEYKDVNPDGLSYSRFCVHYRAWITTKNPILAQNHKAGDKLFVDWAGGNVPIIDEKTGTVQHANIYLAVLGASNFTYAEACLKMDTVRWINCHVNAFAYCRGVPAAVVPDNLKTGVKSNNFYEAEIRESYQELASYYGFTVLPARRRKPRDKSKVEGGVLIVERWILAVLRRQRFFSLPELQSEIRRLLDKLNHRPFRKMPGSRYELWETIDLPALKPLPEQPYEAAVWRKAKVHPDYHVQFSDDFYSTPYTLIGVTVDIRATLTSVEILYRGQRVAAHIRGQGKHARITCFEHRPAAHQAVLSWTPERLTADANKIGPCTAAFVEALIKSRAYPEDAIRSCLGILRLSKDYPGERMEKATARALSYGALSYRSLENILKKGLDRLEDTSPSISPFIDHTNIRGAVYFANKKVPLC